MDEQVLLVVNFDNVCRLCLSSNGAFSDVFKKTESVPLREQIFRVIGFNCSDVEGLPQAICHKCRYIVETAYELRETVQTSNKLLNEVVLVNNSVDDHTNTEFAKNKSENLEEFESLKDQDISNGQTNEVSESQRLRKVAPKSVTCQICLQAFPSTAKANQHARSHYTDSGLTPYYDLERPYRCEKCGGKGLSKLQLVQHHREHLGINPYGCKEMGCEFVGKDLTALRHHASVHGARDFVCPTCGASFKRRWALANHEARLHRAAEASCQQCGARCRNEVALRAHVKGHERARTRRFACQHPGCGRSYLARGHLKAHENAHAADRRHRCAMCSAAYTSASLLNRHMKQHSQRRLWQCGCGARFTEYGGYYTHRRGEHGAARRHRCPACRYGYKSKEQLDKHLESCEPAVKLMDAEAARAPGDFTLHNEGSPEHGALQVVSDDVLRALGGGGGGEAEQNSHLDVQDDLHDLSSEGLLFIHVGP